MNKKSKVKVESLKKSQQEKAIREGFVRTETKNYNYGNKFLMNCF